MGRVLSRPLSSPWRRRPRIAFGEMADALLLASARVMPARLLETGPIPIS
jgi:NAD dependent epimerase/dehydratase family enzyme